MNNKAIGIFDSGLGGLTAVRAMRQLMPHEDIVYFGDTGRVPYGTRSVETIVKYTSQDMSFLQSHDVKFIVCACGTASSAGLPRITDFPIPFAGVVEPTAAAAAQATKNGKIGVIGTNATIQSKSYYTSLLKINPELEIIQIACPLFVPLVENGFISDTDDIPLLAAQRYLEPIVAAGADTLILGCTHFPLLSGVISKVMGKDVRLIDAGFEAARKTANDLIAAGMTNNNTEKGKCSFYVSDKTDGFNSVAKMFLGEDITSDIHHVSIEAF